MADDPIVGIDLGTSNSAVAFVGPDGLARVIPDSEGTKVIPSVVSFHPNGQVLVGNEAKKRRSIDPRNTIYSVKRILGRTFSSKEVTECASRSSFPIKEGANEQPVVTTRAGEFAPSEISALVLDHMRGIASKALGTEVRRVVVTVPANFNDAQRQATAVAGEIAELVVVRVLNEPTAAALAYGHGRGLKQTVAVYDFGGGTFDVTILQLRDNVYEVLATAGDTFLGGDDIDQRLLEFSVDAFLRMQRIDLRYDDVAMQRLRAAAEDAKCALSFDGKTVLKVPEIAVGAGGVGVDLMFSLTRDQFVPRIADIIEKSFPVCDEALRLAGLAPTQIDEVVLVGGTTRIPYLQERVARYFGKPPRTDLNPDEAVALGAALQGAALAAVLDRAVTRPSAPPPPPPPPREGGALPPASADSFTGPSPTMLGRVAPKKVAVPVPRMVETVVERRSFPLPEEPAARPPQAQPEQPTVVIGAQEAPIPHPPPVEVEEVEAVDAPVLLDVTPRGLAVATIGGWCDEIITRNSQIPVEQTRVFSTGADGQTSVEVKICQGESRRFDENTLLGSLVLDKLPSMPRGKLKIAVTFEINTDGILEVRAQDDHTGKAQIVRLQLLGAQSMEEIAAAQTRLKGLRG